MKTRQKKPKNVEILYGVHPIRELLKAKRRALVTLYTTKPAPKVWNEIEQLLPPRTQIQYVKKDVLSRMAQTTDHQSLVAVATPLVIRKKFFDAEKQPFLILLDSIQDPRNLGAILRTAYCTGIDGVIICGKNSAPLGATALKSSAGLAEHLEIYQAPTAAAALELLKKNSYSIYLATLGGKDVTTLQFKKPLCLVIGNEATGISKSLLTSGIQIRLSQRRSDISYNASVAAGILLFTLATELGTFHE